MQIDPDTNNNTIEQIRKARKKTGTRKAAGKRLQSPAGILHALLNLFGRISAACDRASDTVKAAAAILVLIASATVLVYETGAYHAFDADKDDVKPASLMACTFRDAVQSAAIEELRTGSDKSCTQSREHLQTKIDEETASLREEYMEILDSGQGDSFEPQTEAERLLFEKVREQRKEVLSDDPLLLLVNKWHYLPEDYTADPVELPNGQTIGSECYEPLTQMLEDCAEAGGNPIVCSGYRPHYQQVYLFDEQINRWLYAGYGQEEAEDLAATAVAIPGTSEHELGLAADIYSSENMSLDESQIYTFTQQWLMDNCWKYGFVLRYPKDKSDITGIIFEPWHYRYVGEEHARKIYEAGICLEEYLEETDHPEENEEDASDGSDENGTDDSTQDYGQTDYYNDYYY